MDKFKEVPEYLRIHIDRLCDNLARVDSLIDLYDYASSLLRQHKEAARQGHVEPVDRPPDPFEILRAATVFLHASLEDVLRSIAKKHISRTNPEILKDVPFPDSGIRPNKASVADLLQYRGETIGGLIDKSVNQWLERRSFNDCNDIAAFLERIGIDSTPCNSEFATLDEMIKRRHKIVHNADRQDVCEVSRIAKLETIDRDTVAGWRDSVQTFTVQVLQKLLAVADAE